MVSVTPKITSKFSAILVQHCVIFINLLLSHILRLSNSTTEAVAVITTNMLLQSGVDQWLLLHSGCGWVVKEKRGHRRGGEAAEWGRVQEGVSTSCWEGLGTSPMKFWLISGSNSEFWCILKQFAGLPNFLTLSQPLRQNVLFSLYQTRCCFTNQAVRCKRGAEPCTFLASICLAFASHVVLFWSWLPQCRRWTPPVDSEVQKKVCETLGISV